MSEEMVPATPGEITPKADWMSVIPLATDQEDLADQIAAAIASAESVQAALDATTETMAVKAFAGHTLRIVGARLMEGDASGKPGYFAVIDAVDLTGGTVTLEKEVGGRIVHESVEVEPDSRVTLNTGAPSVLAVLAVAYRQGELPFTATPVLISTSTAGRTVLKLVTADEPF